MKFNDFKKKVRAEEIETPDVLDKIDASYEKTSIKERRGFHLPTFYKYAIPALAVFVLSLVLIVLVSNENSAFNNGVKSNSSSINTFSSMEELNQKLSYRNNRNYRFDLVYKNDMWVDEYAMAAPGAIPTMVEDASATPKDNAQGYASLTEDVSKTNTQYEDVDEADVIKSDGKNIYRVLDGSLLINSIDNGVIGETVKKDIVTGKNNKLFNTNLYLTDDYVIVITSLHEYSESDDYGYYYYRYNTYNSYVLVNVYNKENNELSKSFKGKGYIIDSRIVYNDETDLNTLYFIYVENIKSENNNYSLPSEIVDGKTVYTSCNKIYYSDDFYNNAYTHFVSIRLDDELKTNSVIQTGPTNYPIVYVNNNSIYLVSRTSRYEMEMFIVNSIDSIGSAESIIKYNINDGAITPVASLIVSGELLNQFSLDEYNGYLRLALAQTNHNKLEIYEIKNGKFSLTGSITEGLGLENETIKSARFDKDTCLIVTAKNTDPLYKIDLSDPTNPTILGLFKEDGFNTYLQYLTGDLIGYAFAIGYNTEDISEYYNVRKGTKFDLYNIKGDNPVELDEINYEPTYIEAIDNHKALFVYKNYIGFEVNRTYYLYEIVMGDDDYKLNEVLSYEYNLEPANEELSWLYDNNSQLTESRMYYVNGYFYLIYKTKDDATCINYSIYDSMIVSFDSEYNIVNKVE